MFDNILSGVSVTAVIKLVAAVQFDWRVAPAAKVGPRVAPVGSSASERKSAVTAGRPDVGRSRRVTAGRAQSDDAGSKRRRCRLLLVDEDPGKGEPILPTCPPLPGRKGVCDTLCPEPLAPPEAEGY